MKKLIFLALIWMMSTATVFAKVYDITPTKIREGRGSEWVATNSPCPNSGSYTDMRSSYKCSSNVTLDDGDSIITGGRTSQLYLEGYSAFNGNNTIGSADRSLSLNLGGQSFSANGLHVYGHVDNGSDIKLAESTILGSLRSSTGGVEISDVDVGSYVEANNQVKVTGGSIVGHLLSSTGGVEISNVDVGSYVEANNQVKVTDGSIGGYVLSSNGGVEISNVDVGSYVEANNQIRVTDGSIGGHVLSSNGGVEISDVDVGSYVDANNQVKVIDGSIGGYVVSSNGGVEITTSVDTNKLIEGYISAKGAVKVVNYKVNEFISAGEYVEINSSQVSGRVSSLNGAGAVNDSKIEGSVDVKEYLAISESSYVCGVASSSNGGAEISSSYIGDKVSTEGYLKVINSSIFGTANVNDAGMGLSSAAIFADDKAISFPDNNYIDISNDSTLCGTANSSYYYNRNLVAYCGLNDPSCNAQESKGKCPVDLVSSSEYRDFYDYCGITPPEPEPEPEPLPDPKKCIDVEAFAKKTDFEKKWATMGYFIDNYNGQDGAEPEPFVHNNRLRITNNIQGQAAVGAYNYIFPSSNNIVEVEFDHFAYGHDFYNPGADGIAIVFSDASVPPSTGAFGGPLGYGVKPDGGGIEGFAGGWIAFGIDEYGNFSSEGSYYQDQNPLDSSPGRDDHSITIRGSGENKGPGEYIDANNHRRGTFPEGWFGGYRFIKKNSNVGKLDDVSQDEIHRYRMTIDSRVIDGRDAGVYVSIERAIYQGDLEVDANDRGKLKGSNLTWEVIIDSFNIMQGFAQSTAPSEFRVSVAGSTGLFKNVHEIDNFQICADEFQEITNGIHHFEFDYSGVGSTCQPSEVTLRACMDEDCNTLYPEDLKVTLSPRAGHDVANWVQSSPVSFKGSKHLQLQGVKAGFVTIGIANTHGIPQFGFEDARCRVNGGELSAEACEIEFRGNTLSVVAEDVIANKESSENNFFEFCSSSSATNTTRDIKLSMTYDVAPIEQPSVTLNYKKNDGKWSSDQTISGPDDDPTYLRDVYFDKYGQAKFKFTYPEVGQVSFNASIEGIEDSKGVGTFVSYPHRLQANASGRCGSKSGCDRGFIAAGEEFTISITALQYSEDSKGGMLAKNYQEEQMVVSNEVVYPATSAGGKKAELLTDTYQHIASDDAKTSFSQTVSEVGAFKFSISAPEGDVENTSLYLGKSSFLIQPATITLGRFYPEFYRLRGQYWDYAGSQSFNYMNQNFDSMWYEVEVLTGGDAPKSVENYKYFNKEHVASFELSDSLNRFNAQGNLTPSWLDALGSIQHFILTPPLSGECNAVEGLCWMKKTSAIGYEDGPFNLNGSTQRKTDIKVGVAIEPDPISVYGDPVLSVQPDIRFGRIDLDDVGGNQGTTLYIPLRAEYWNGSRFITNTDDSQTDVTGVTAAQNHIWPTGTNAAPSDVSLGGGDRVSSGVSRAVTAEQASPYRQQTRLWLDLDDAANALPWLKYDWDNDGSEENPSSVVTFGIHRGNDRVIYRGEPGLTGQ